MEAILGQNDKTQVKLERTLLSFSNKSLSSQHFDLLSDIDSVTR